MNSLNYLSRQLDVLATSGTPPSTPTRGSHFNASGRPPRAKSYGRIPSRRPSHQGQHSTEATPSFPAHASKRSFSSPALWSFRKPTLTPTASFVNTPPAVLKRTTSYEFGQAPKVEPEVPLARPLVYRVLSAIWTTMYTLWMAISGYLTLPSILIPRAAQALDNTRNAAEIDTSADEKEDTDDDGIVTRAPKRSSIEQQYKDATEINASLEVYQMSTTTTLTLEESISRFDQPIFILDPPSPEEVQARTETPRIDLIPPTPRSRTPSSTVRRKSEDNSPLLPNPLSASLLTKSGSSPVSTIASGGNSLQQQPQQSSRKTPGVHQPKTLVLDLDETLIHSTSRALRAHAGGGLFSMGGFGFGFGEKRGREAGHMVEVVLGGRCTLYHVYKRPFVDYFLRKVHPAILMYMKADHACRCLLGTPSSYSLHPCKSMRTLSSTGSTLGAAS